MPRLPHRTPARLVAGSALLALVLTGCGSQGSPKASGSSSGTPSSSPSATQETPTGTPTAKPTTAAQVTVQRLRDRVHKSGTGRFSEVTTSIPGAVLATVAGRYLLADRQVAAGLQVPQHGAKPLTAKVDLLEDDAFLHVAEWKEPARSCWLRTTGEQLSQDYGLDIATADQVPIPVQLLDDFTAVSANGKELVDGTVPIASVLPLLSGSTKATLVAAKPKGVVPAFLTFHGDHLQITVPGYALSSALSQSLGIDPSKLTSIAQSRLLSGVTIRDRVAAVTAPPGGRQMSAADLKANRCG